MAIGRSFAEALGKALRSTGDHGRPGSGPAPDPDVDRPTDRCWPSCAIPTDGRIYARRAGAARRRDASTEVAEATRHRPVVRRPDRAARRAAAPRSPTRPCSTPGAAAPGQAGRAVRPADRRAAAGAGRRGRGAHAAAARLGIRPVYKTVDTCAAEFAASTPYHYSPTTSETEVAPQPERPKVLILGSGPNRIGQGIEFDYSCVHAVMALRDGRLRDRHGQLQPGDRLHRLRHRRPALLRAADLEDVLEVVHAEQAVGHGRRGDLHARRADPARAGAAAQGRRACRSSGTQPGGDRPGRGPRRVRRGARRAPGCRRPRHGTATSFDEARDGRRRDRLPGAGPARPTCSAGAAWRSSTTRRRWRATSRGPPRSAAEHPVLVDRFLDDAIEIDVDALCDGTEVYLGGVMEHIEEAGIHSGDSACALPPITLGARRHRRGPARHRGDRARRRRARAAQRAVRAQGRRALRARGQPAGRRARCRSCRRRRRCRWPRRPPGSCSVRPIADLRAEGLLPADGDGGDLPRGRADRGQGGGAAVPPVPHADGPGRRLRARAGDEVHRRGDGHRRGVRHGVREVAGRGLRVAADRRARCSSRSPTGTSGR